MNRKYVLTADHCFVDKTQINNFQYWCAPNCRSWCHFCSKKRALEVSFAECVFHAVQAADFQVQRAVWSHSGSAHY